MLIEACLPAKWGKNNLILIVCLSLRSYDDDRINNKYNDNEANKTRIKSN